MLKKSLFISFIFVVFSLQTAFSQGLVNGTVVDVIDGRTLVVSNSIGKEINVRLRFLEIPEPEQPLYDVVKNHLKDLAVGKKIFVTKIQIFSNYTLGVAMLNEKNAKIDLSQQMIRDGAGWFDVYDASAATDESADDYQATEILAKNEKRGVWGIPEMKTPWEHRDEKTAKNVTTVSSTSVPNTEKKADDLSLAEMVKNSSKDTNGFGRLAIYDFEYKTAKPVAETGSSTETKSSNPAGNNPTNDLSQVYFSQFNKGSTSTKPYEFTVQNGKTSAKITMMFLYNYSMENSNKNVDKISLWVMSDVTDKAFLQGKNVSIMLDNGKKINLGKSQYIPGKRSEGIIFEDIDRNEVLSILESNSVTVVIGKYKKQIPDSYKQTIDNFVATLK
jgi:endonuclease YncB( thermonuclease family)